MPAVSQTKPPAKKAAPPKPKSDNIIDRIAPMEPIEGGVKIVIYGMSGSGKTTLWGTFPGKILVIVTSNTVTPGELRSLDTPELRKKIDVVVLKSSMEVKPLVEHLRENPNKYATIVLDHATGLQDLCLAEVLNLEVVPAQLSWGLASQQQYGQVSLQTKENLRALIGLEAQNVVIVAQQRAFNTDGDGDSLLDPFVAASLMPSTVGWLNAAVDYIVQTVKRTKVEIVTTTIAGKPTYTEKKTDKVEFVLRTAPNEFYVTKLRVPKDSRVVPEFIVDPNYDKLAKVIKG